MIQSHLGNVKMSTISEKSIKQCAELGVDIDELLQNMLFADFYCIMCALTDEYGLETFLQEVTRNCEQLINERTNNNGNTNSMD